MIGKTEREKLLKEYLEKMSILSCRFIVRERYEFKDTTEVSKDDFEYRYSRNPIYTETQVMRYLSYLSYADKGMLEKAALIYKSKKKIPHVVTNSYEIKKMVDLLVYLGCVCKRKYVDAGVTAGKPKEYLTLFFLTNLGIDIFRGCTESEAHIESNLIKRKDPEDVMRWLTTNNVMLKIETMCQGREVRFTRKVKMPDPWGRHAIYGCVEDDDMVAVFEPVMYHQITKDPVKAQKRAGFIKAYFEETRKGRKKILVFIIQDRTEIESVYQGYATVISDSDKVYVTHEALAYDNPGKDVNLAPFVRISSDAGKVPEVANPPFVLRDEKYTGKRDEEKRCIKEEINPVFDPESEAWII
ncbi:MAG: hypothetical protein K6E47_14345 [Lachnospiraceae bacterium]|nr:hypothetical protein [Lachnospiraceae bacterium]